MLDGDGIGKFGGGGCDVNSAYFSGAAGDRPRPSSEGEGGGAGWVGTHSAMAAAISTCGDDVIGTGFGGADFGSATVADSATTGGGADGTGAGRGMAIRPELVRIGGARRDSDNACDAVAIFDREEGFGSAGASGSTFSTVISCVDSGPRF